MNTTLIDTNIKYSNMINQFNDVNLGFDTRKGEKKNKNK